MFHKSLFMFLIICFIFFFYSCKKDTTPVSANNEPEEMWVVDTTLIHEMVAKVDSNRIWENMLHITSYPDRDSYGENIEEVQDWLYDFAGGLGLQVGYQRYIENGYRVFFVNNSRGFLIGSSDYITEDGGYTWNSVEIPRLTDIQFITENIGFTSRYRYDFWFTNDGGYNWERRINGFGGEGFFFFDADTGWTVSRRSVYKTNDGGYNWEEIVNFGFFVNDIIFIDHISLISTEGKILLSNDYWISWSEIIVGEENEDFGKFKFLNDLGLIWTYSGNIFFSKDKGNTWNKVFQGYILQTEISDFKTLWVAERKYLYCSSDSGQTWNLKLQFFKDPYGLEFSDSKTGWLSTKSGLFKTNDAGATWTNHLNSLPFKTTWENVIITIPGKLYPEKEVLLTGHFDTLGETPGADDNATGMTTLLEIAHILSQYNFANSIKIVFFQEKNILVAVVNFMHHRQNKIMIKY